MKERPMIKRRVLQIVSAAFVAAAVIAVAPSAQAQMLRSHPSLCASPTFASFNGNGQLMSGPGPSNTNYLCPVDRLVTSMTIHGHQNTTNGIQGRACFTGRFGFVGSCGQPGQTSGTGVKTIMVSTIPTWSANPDEYKYMQLTLTPTLSGNFQNTVFGFSHQ
jgi:hypothetical protein